MTDTDVRLIDANAMYNYWLENGENECVYDTNAVLYSIDEQPTIDPEDLRPHGRWIRHDPDPESMRTFHELGIGRAMGRNSVFWTCSCCANWGIPLQNYCSNCGATMDEEADNGN